MERKPPSELIPAPYGKLFTAYDSFNSVQTSVLNDLLHTDKSIVLSAPTGSGKTVAFELAIVRMLLENERLQSTSNNNNNILPKAIYIAPIKALCSEKFENWKARFETVGINCAQLTGDTQSENLMALREAQIVISTPEKWDSLTRRWRDFGQLIPAVQLFMIDEVHLLNEDTRGPILEAIVARMKSNGVKRFLVASATIPNIEDLSSWIGTCNINVAQYVFNEMQRPVPLEKHVIGINTALKGFQFDMKLNYQLPEIIRKYAEGKATLIFCSSRKSTEMAAFNLNKINAFLQLTNQQKSYLNQLAQRLIDVKLRKLVENGIAYHHAGLQYADRNLIESSFRDGFLMVLISTSTLAMGINLPAHLVVIKSTETYMRGSYVEYPETMLLQMIGRAGRPQYDTKGVAVVLTQKNKIQKYEQLIKGKSPIESHLHKHLIEHLNSEIALNSINNLEAAMDWIRSTYLYVRSVRNPTHYGFSADMSRELVEHKLEELSYKQIIALEKANLVTINQENGLKVQTTPIGKLMAKYYLSFETMTLFRNLNGNETLQNILDLIANCKELNEFNLRVNEKKILNALNKTPIRFPIKGRIKSSELKISCLIQAVLGNINIPAPGLVQESLKIFRIGERISKCLLEYVRLCIQKNFYSKTENSWFKTLLCSLITAKCFHVKLWENSEYASKQLHGIGTVYSTQLFNAGKTTLKSIADTDARTIEYILNKPAPFGDEVLQNLLTFPEYEIKLTRKSADFVVVCAKQINESYIHKGGAVAVLIVGDSSNNLLHLAENFVEISIEYGYFERTIKILNPKDVEYIYAHIVHTTLVGVDVNDTLEINAPKDERSEKTAKKSKKTKKQTRLKIAHNETLNDTDFLTEDTLNEENNKIDDNEITNKPPRSNLKRFEFYKSKIQHNGLKKDNPIEISLNETDNLPKIATIKPLNETTLRDDTSDINTSNISRIVQRKLTEFFAQRKKTELLTSKTSLNDLTVPMTIGSSHRENSGLAYSLHSNVNQNTTPSKSWTPATATATATTTVDSNLTTHGSLTREQNEGNFDPGLPTNCFMDQSKAPLHTWSYGAAAETETKTLPTAVDSHLTTYGSLTRDQHGDNFEQGLPTNGILDQNTSPLQTWSYGVASAIETKTTTTAVDSIPMTYVSLPREQHGKNFDEVLSTNSFSNPSTPPLQTWSYGAASAIETKRTTTTIDLTDEPEKNVNLNNVNQLSAKKNAQPSSFQSRKKIQILEHLILPPKSNKYEEFLQKNVTENTSKAAEQLVLLNRKRLLNEAESQPPTKKQRYENNSSFKETYKSCPISLASFLGDMGQKHSITSLLEQENVQKQQCSSIKPMEDVGTTKSKSNSEYTTNSISCSKTKNTEIQENKANKQNQLPFVYNNYQSIQNRAAPLDLSKNFNESYSTASLPKTTTENEPNHNTISDEIIANPTDEEFALWYKVAITFQRLPRQAMSLKNFRYVYNKVIAKEQQIKKQLKISSNSNFFENPSHSNGHNFQHSMKPKPKRSFSSEETTHTSSPTSSFRLQLFANDKSPLNSNIPSSTVEMINQNVMNYVLNSKCIQNQEFRSLSFEEEITIAIDDLEKELSP